MNLVSDYLFENYNIKDITLDIDPSNIASVQTALSCGYDLDEEEYLEKGLQGRTLYKKDNIYYCNKRKKK